LHPRRALEFSRLPMKEVTADMHRVTRWSRFEVAWDPTTLLAL